MQAPCCRHPRRAFLDLDIDKANSASAQYGDKELCTSPERHSGVGSWVADGERKSIMNVKRAGPPASGFSLGVIALVGSARISRLGESEVVELIASVIANLVEGEILQLKAVNGKDSGAQEQLPTVGKDSWNIYLQKTYLKTASLMAKGARAAVVLGGCREGEPWKEIAYAYGRNLGIAFQVRLT